MILAVKSFARSWKKSIRCSKAFITEHRPELEIDKVATGEYWYGQKAFELGLVDKIQTSDDFLLGAKDDKAIYSVKFSLKKNIAERFGLAASTALESAFIRFWSKGQTLFK